MSTSTVTTYTSGQLHFSGLGNGTDFDTMITQLVKAESYRIKKLENSKYDWQDKTTAIQSLNSSMLSLKSANEAFDTMNEFMVKQISTGSSAFTASADSSAQVGAHQIHVGQIAKNAVSISSGFVATAATSVTATAQTFSYTYAGGTPVTLNVAAGTTLTQLKDQINSDPTNPGVLASVIKVSETESRLQLSGKDLGAAKTLSVSSTLDGLSGSFTTTQAAADARIKLDGFPQAADEWITRTSNSFSDALQGVTLTLKETTTGPVSLSVTTNTQAIKDNVKTFVEQVNAVRQQIRDLTKWDSQAKKGSILTGNSTVQMIDSQLKTLTAQRATGFDATLDAYSVLSQVGVTTDANENSTTNGMLQLDEAKLDEALAKNPDAVAALFSARDTGKTDSANFIYGSHVKSVTKAGTYKVEYAVDGAGAITSATINGHAATIDNTGKTLTGASGMDEAGLVIKITNLTQGAFSGNVRLQLGKVAGMNDTLKKLTSSGSGPLAVMERSFTTTIEGIDKQIESEQQRIVTLERNLRMKFAKVDALLGYYDQLNKQITSQVSGLSGGKK